MLLVLLLVGRSGKMAAAAEEEEKSRLRQRGHNNSGFAGGECARAAARVDGRTELPGVGEDGGAVSGEEEEGEGWPGNGAECHCGRQAGWEEGRG